jgi:hypothetical protein
LNALASVAFDPAAATLYGIRLPERWQDREDNEAARFPALVASREIPSKIVAGTMVHLLSHCSANGTAEKAFKVNHRPRGFYGKVKRQCLCDFGGMSLRVNFSHIDWIKTAEINGWAIPSVAPVYRIPFEQKSEAKTA